MHSRNPEFSKQSLILRRLSIAFLLVGLFGVFPNATLSNSLQIAVTFGPASGWPLLSVPGPTNDNLVYELQSGTTLTNWTSLGTFLGGLSPYADLLATNDRTRFYRVREFTKAETNDWSNQVRSTGPLRKFILPLNEPRRVYFHNSQVFHYEFARQHLPELPTETPESFEEAVLYPSKQDAVIGGLYFPPGHETEYGVEFVSAEPFEPARLVELYKTVAARVSIPGRLPFLVPPASQRDFILSNLNFFASSGVLVREITEFVTNSLTHSEGWTVGLLKFIPAAELDGAIAAGILTPDTILITDATPRDLPPIAGLISLTPSSPNSHTTLRLQSAGLPYLDLPTARRSNVTNLVGKRVLFATLNPPPRIFSVEVPHYPPSWQREFRLIDFSTLSEPLQAAILERNARTAISVGAMERFGSYSTNTEVLNLEHTPYFGSKAANYGVLRRTIPSQSPPGIAFSFDLWLDFMAQSLPGRKSLKQEIDDRVRLIGTNSGVLSEKLKEVRDLIEDVAQFTSAQQAAVTNALAVFEPSKKIRFRSSSNAEDLPNFSAAGLYESHSGCLLDDLNPIPGDNCQCDPSDDKRRSVFRAIRQVFASFYNDQAFLERRRFEVDEGIVGMAILVHYSFPDEIELANGIANVDFLNIPSAPQVRGLSIVSQRGAVSVANPEGSELPERVDGTERFGKVQLTPVAMSTIRPPQTFVLDYPAEYNQLQQLFAAIGRAYLWDRAPGVTRLNFEFKKTAAGLSIKQVRQVYTGSGLGDSIVLPERIVFETFQGGETPAGLDDSHLLKSVWEFESKGWIPNRPTTNTSLFEMARVIYILDGKIATNEVHLASAKFVTNDATPLIGGALWRGLSAPNGLVTNQFVGGADGQIFNLGISFPSTLPRSTPFVYPSDLRMFLGRPGILGTAELMVGAEGPGSEHVASFSTNGVTIETSFTRVATPVHSILGFGPTENLGRWKKTIISGLVSVPIVLRGYFSQTYKPSRHNFVESFLFEPGLEEGMPASILAELQAANIQRIRFVHNLVHVDRNTPRRSIFTLELIGVDGTARPVPSK